MNIFISADGTAKFIYSDELQSVLPATSIKRASQVEPCVGGWSADMSPSGVDVVLGPFPTRGEALRAEVEWLEARGL